MKFGTVRGRPIVRSRSSAILVNFGPLFRDHKFLTVDILGTFCRRVTKFSTARGLANLHLVSEFGELWPTFPYPRHFSSDRNQF